MNSENSEKPPQKENRKYISQSDIPRYALEDALKLGKALYDNFGGRTASAAPHQLAIAVEISPTSSNWKFISGTSIAYGLTIGGYNARIISLADLGRRIVAPTEEGDDDKAKVDAVLKPQICRKFFEKYNHAKFPQDKIAKNILEEMGVPKDRLEDFLAIIRKNGYYAKIIVDTKTGPFVAIENNQVLSGKKLESSELIEQNEGDLNSEIPKIESEGQPEKNVEKGNTRVFISHGKNKNMVNHLKELISYGKLSPVVAEEHETTSKPVPEKVLEEMRSCFAGVIHIDAERQVSDENGEKKHQLNENVLIEIGASMALYGKNIILLVKKGVQLPSNLQGMYRCEYDDEKLDIESTMKLLKAFSEFK
ncbi:nucleotide-binding protein [Candidatus Pacearchaeota archaeon]|nr:nucleotide-binding protein [Candidatus Pacearchaeota archaeon]